MKRTYLTKFLVIFIIINISQNFLYAENSCESELKLSNSIEKVIDEKYLPLFEYKLFETSSLDTSFLPNLKYVTEGNTVVFSENSNIRYLLTSDLQSCVSIFIHSKNNSVLLSHMVINQDQYQYRESINLYVNFLKKQLSTVGGSVNGATILILWGSLNRSSNLKDMEMLIEELSNQQPVKIYLDSEKKTQEVWTNVGFVYDIETQQSFKFNSLITTRFLTKTHHPDYFDLYGAPRKEIIDWNKRNPYLDNNYKFK